MICPKCGNEYDDRARCCFKCGALNPNNSENFKNNTTKSILNVQEKELDKYKDNKFFNTYSFYNKTGNKRISFLNNMPLFATVNIIFFLIVIIFGGNIIKSIGINIGAFSYFINCLISMGYLICFEFIFDKANYNWWFALIPIYNIRIFLKLIFDNSKYLLAIIILPLIPILALYIFNYFNLDKMLITIFIAIIPIICYSLLIIIYVISMCRFAKRFNTNQLLTIFFSFVMIPVIAFKCNYKYVEEIN